MSFASAVDERREVMRSSAPHRTNVGTRIALGAVALLR